MYKNQMMKQMKLTALLILLCLLIPYSAFAAESSSAESISEASVEDSPATDSDAEPPLTGSPDTEDSPATPPDTSPEEQITPKVTLIAPDGIRAGEEVTFTVMLHSTIARAIQGSLSYDPAILTFVSSEATTQGWNFTFSQTADSLQYLGLSTMGEDLSGENALFTVTFRVASNALTDDPLAFTLAPPVVYDGENEVTYEGDTPSFAITRPLSTDCTLDSLTVEGGNLSPAFSPEITEYTLTLPYSTETAQITALPHDSEYATIKQGNTTLAVGENRVEITVISESGLQKVYTILITRSPDPNYIPSADNRILSLTLSEGLLFPAFSTEITEYSVYIVRGQQVTLTPIPADKAIAFPLTIPADTAAIDYTLTCNAENGSARIYTFHVILLETPEELAQIEREKQPTPEQNYLRNGFILAIGITLFFLGFVFGFLIFGRRKKTAPQALPPMAENEPVITPIAPIPADDAPQPESDLDSDALSEPAESDQSAESPGSDEPTEAPESISENTDAEPSAEPSKKEKKKKKRKH